MTPLAEFRLPYPPSVNTIWRSIVVNGSVRVLLSKEGRGYREAVKRAIHAAHYARASIAGPLEVRVNVFPPDRRRRDVDNICKAVFDALTHAGVWNDDSQIMDLHVRKFSPGAASGVAVLVLEPRRLRFESLDEQVLELA